MVPGNKSHKKEKRRRKMKTREVTFYSEGTKMIGTIYLPDDYKEGETTADSSPPAASAAWTNTLLWRWKWTT